MRQASTMDLYLLSPVFMKKMIRRPSATAEGLPESDQDPAELEDTSRLVADDSHAEVDQELEMEALARQGRRRSSLDRMLRQHAYIIICALCYACSLPGHRT